LASLLLQSQAFFTAILAVAFLGERLKSHNVIGMALAGIGLAIFAVAALRGKGGGLTLPLLGMIIVAALGWAGANVATRKMPGESALSLMVWSSLFSPLPLAALSLLLEGPARIAGAFTHITPLTVGALAYLVLLSTLLAYGLWNRLILRHGASRVAPFSLLVPVFGCLSAALIYGEAFGLIDAIGSALIVLGLLLHAFGGKLLPKRS
jgi:O-acetylserine/cysteine efflux transporter